MIVAKVKSSRSKIHFHRFGNKEMKIIDRSALHDVFDREFYMLSNPDVKIGKIDPLQHYIEYGMKECRNPHPLFDVEWFVQQHPEAADDPFTSYLNGIGTRPHPLFDGAWYLHHYPDVRTEGLHPFVHYTKYGQGENRSPHPLFDASWYIIHNPEASGRALYHYLQGYGRKPNPLFDDQFYLKYCDPQVGIHRPALIDYLASSSRRITGRPHPLFDGPWYLARNSDVAARSLHPFAHYMTYGQKENRDPHPLFDAEWYVGQHPDANGRALLHYLEGRGKNPHPLFDDEYYCENHSSIFDAQQPALVDYVLSGWRENDPNILFDTHWYLSKIGENLKADTTALKHYCDVGESSGHSSHPVMDLSFYASQLENGPMHGTMLADFLHEGDRHNKSLSRLFDPHWYRKQIDNEITPGLRLFQHYIKDGWQRGFSPHPLFDIRYYFTHSSDVAQANVEPLSHYLTSGYLERRRPHPLFDISYYLQSYPDVANAGIEPLQHYLAYGAIENRNPNAVFDTQWYTKQHEGRLDGQNALVHYVTLGRIEGRDPSPTFSCEYYLARYPDVRKSGLDPLQHFILAGYTEGRSTRPADRFSDVCSVLDIPYEIRRAPPVLSERDVCLFMAYTANGQLSSHIHMQLDAWKNEGYLIVLILATDGVSSPLPPELDRYEGVLLRINHGWDFAAWAAAMAVFPSVWQARSMVIINDSIYGPTDKDLFRDLIRRVRASKADMVALTDSYQIKHHCMSYFMGLTRSGLRSDAVRQHWASIRSIRDKFEVINQYEITPVAQWQRAGINVEILFPTKNDVAPPINPTLHRWEDLLRRGLPFIKVQLLRDTLPGTVTRGWEKSLAQEPKLLSAIKEHLSHTAQPIDFGQLEERRLPSNLNNRPIPAPKRRFKRNFALKTFYGATHSMRPHEATDLALEVPFKTCNLQPYRKPVAVIAHIFYPEMTQCLLEGLVNIPGRADIFITTDTEAKKNQISKQLLGYANGSFEIRIVPNVGRDLAAMFVGCRDVFQRYEFFLHVHSKRSPHDPRFANWRDFLLDNLLGSPQIVSSILNLLDRPDVGIVFSDHFCEVRNLLNWGYDYTLAKGLLARIGVDIRKDFVLDFPSSSFFWGRTAAVKPLLDLDLQWAEFPIESGQVDGTLAHAIERTLLYIAESAGFRWVKVSKSGYNRDETLIPVLSQQEIEVSIRRAFRPLLGNALTSIYESFSFPEIVPIATRSDLCVRPRINLIIPSLHPKHIFGGITTALKIFDELAGLVGQAVDKRILCTSYPVELEAMVGRPNYTLVPLGSAFDDMPHSVVDITDRESGELPIRSGDIFITTAWWTDVVGQQINAAQKQYHNRSLQNVYLIQDHEPSFYPWSSHYALSQATYSETRDFVAIVNSEELANFIQLNYNIKDLKVLRYSANPKISRALRPVPRERIILIYGRPSVARNCFEILCAGLRRWQQSDPVSADGWRIVSAGEEYDPAEAGDIAKLEVRGKLSLEEYANLLSKSSVGVSLMLSPHPSYPPLEMAAAGLITITNSYENKDLRLRSRNIVSLTDLTPSHLAEALEKAVNEAKDSVGNIVPFGEIGELSCNAPTYDPRSLADHIFRLVD